MNKMELRRDPFPLVFDRGDDATVLTLLAFVGLEHSTRAEGCRRNLLKRRRSDGAFPSRLDRERWGMRETVRTALLLLEAGLPADGPEVDSAVRFVLARQNRDGGWCENPALDLPAEQTWLSGRRTVTWLTADAVDLLRRVGRGDGGACRRALAWLGATQTERGGWPSVAREDADQGEVRDDPDATAQVTFVLGEVDGDDAPAYRRGRELFEGYLDRCALDVERGYRIRLRDGAKADLDVYYLTHLLLSWPLDPPRRFQAGYGVHDPRVRRMMEMLVELQRPDGGWRPFFADESSPTYTVVAVKALVLSGALSREDLVAGAVPYASRPSTSP